MRMLFLLTALCTDVRYAECCTVRCAADVRYAECCTVRCAADVRYAECCSVRCAAVFFETGPHQILISRLVVNCSNYVM